MIELDLDSGESKLVVEAVITDQPGAHYVKLLKSVNFNEPIVYPLVEDVLVIITDNTGVVDTLQYTESGIYQTSKIEGVVGRMYDLKIIVENKTYTSRSVMPAKVPLDTNVVIDFQFGPTLLKYIIPVYKDPQELGNRYRFLLTVNGVQDKDILLFNDNVNNGQYNGQPLRSSDITIKQGDVVEVEMQTITDEIYNYYYTLNQITARGGGGGSTPANPPSNISGGALGNFSVVTTQTKTLIIP
ncbi:MAG TPA: DUF4249 domain-containing protein [Bacteroidales bacterium]|nr:DUF4249 domain-containing protein [Bacteroidales bacterium]